MGLFLWENSSHWPYSLIDLGDRLIRLILLALGPFLLREI